MISYKEFEKECLDRLIKERESDDPAEIRKYVKEDGSQKVIKEFYAEGVERFKKGTKHDDRIAFGYCISTAVENLNLLY